MDPSTVCESHTSSVEPEDIMGNQHRIKLDMTEE